MVDTEAGDEGLSPAVMSPAVMSPAVMSPAVLSPAVRVPGGGEKSPEAGVSEMLMVDEDGAESSGSEGWWDEVDEEFIFEGEREEEKKPAATAKWKWLVFAGLNVVFFWVGFGNVLDLQWTRVARAVAHGAGRTVTCNYAILLLSSCKYGWTRLGIAGRGNMHRGVAKVMITLGLFLHAAPWIAMLCMHVLKFSGRLFDGERNETQIIVSGIVLTSLFLLVLLSTRKVVRSYGDGTLFRRLHPVLASLILVMIFVHANNTARRIIAVPAFLYLLDRIVRVFDPSVLAQPAAFAGL